MHPLRFPRFRGTETFPGGTEGEEDITLQRFNIVTKEQVLSKLTALCAKGEHCIHDVRQKMVRWEIDELTQARVIAFLLDERYIDEERYCRAFINDKIRYNRWGKKKVAQALYMKGISSSVYQSMLDEMAEKGYEEILLPLLQSKLRTLQGKGLSDYELRGRLLRFALQRGFTYEQSSTCLEGLLG